MKNLSHEEGVRRLEERLHDATIHHAPLAVISEVENALTLAKNNELTVFINDGFLLCGTTIMVKKNPNP